MKIIVNNQTFENARFSVNEGIAEFQFDTDLSLSELEQILDPTDVLRLEVYTDENELQEQWYIRSLQELAYQKQENSEWRIVAKMKVSVMNNDSEAEIRDNIEDGNDAIFELAELISILSDKQDDQDKEFKTQQNTLNRLSNLYDILADRVAELENAQQGGN